jgi:hypothetical protein
VEVPAAVLNESGILGIRATAPAAAGGNGAGSSQPFVGIVDCGASFSALNWKAAALAGLPPKGDPSYATGRDGRPAPGSGGAGGVAVVGMVRGGAGPALLCPLQHQLAALRGANTLLLRLAACSAAHTCMTTHPSSRTSLPALLQDGRPQVVPTAPVQFTFAGAAAKEGGRYRFEQPPPAWRPWQPVVAAVGDLPVFSMLLGDGSQPFDGPAAVIGLDVLSQRRVVVAAGAHAAGRARQLFVSPA